MDKASASLFSMGPGFTLKDAEAEDSHSCPLFFASELNTALLIPEKWNAKILADSKSFAH
jgi:hypothetical protein